MQDGDNDREERGFTARIRTGLLAQIEQADAAIAELQSQQRMLTESLEAVPARSEFLEQYG